MQTEKLKSLLTGQCQVELFSKVRLSLHIHGEVSAIKLHFTTNDCLHNGITLVFMFT